MTTKSREGQPNPDTAIVEAALEKHELPQGVRNTVWHALHFDGYSVAQVASMTQKYFPAFAQALREGIAARRGQRFGGHGGG